MSKKGKKLSRNQFIVVKPNGRVSYKRFLPKNKKDMDKKD